MGGSVKLRQLRAFQAIMATGNLSVAAERLNLSQPAVSKQLAALEEALNLRLFHRRKGGPIAPTPAGIEFYKAIEGTLAGIDLIPDLAREITESASVRLRIAATPPLLNSRPLVETLAAFRAAYPMTRLALDARHRLDIEEWIASRQADLGLALLPVRNPLLTTRTLAMARAVAVLPPAHRLAAKSKVTAAELEGETVILPTRQPLRDRIDAMLQADGGGVLATIEASSAITCCRLASAGLGIAICDPFSATAFRETDVVTKTWEPEVKLTYGAILVANRDVDPMITWLLGELGRCFATVGER